MTKQITNHVSITVEIKENKTISSMKSGYATLFDHNTKRVIRTVRGQYVLADKTEKEFLCQMLTKFTPIITRYTILADAYEDADDLVRLDIEEWLDNDPQFNDELYHGDRK